MNLTKYRLLNGITIAPVPGPGAVDAASWLHAKKLLGFPLSGLQEELLEKQLAVANSLLDQHVLDWKRGS
jgi:hypothetical protein